MGSRDKSTHRGRDRSRSRIRDRHDHHKSSDDRRLASSTRGGDRSDEEREQHGSDYKALYKEMKHELKKQRRDLQEMEDRYEQQRRETRKAQQDTQDLWKIYHQLQTELQQFFAKNATLSSEKAALQKEVDDIKREYDKIRTGTVDPVKLKEALMAMQKEKLDMQKRFNDIVIENKKLREKEARYGPRLSEIDKAQSNLIKVRTESAEMTAKVHKLRHDMTLIGFSKESVEKYQRWNSLLSLECDQNTYRVRQLESAGSGEQQGPHIAALVAQRQQVFADHRRRSERA